MLTLTVDSSHRHHTRRIWIRYLLRRDLKRVRQLMLALGVALRVAHSGIDIVALDDRVSRAVVHHVTELVEFRLFFKLVPRLLVVVSVAEAEQKG